MASKEISILCIAFIVFVIIIAEYITTMRRHKIYKEMIEQEKKFMLDVLKKLGDEFIPRI